MTSLLNSLTIVKQRYFGSFTFDATIAEFHNSTNEITQQPIESGALSTDHSFAKNDTFTIVGEVSDTPITPNASFDKGSTSARSSSAYQQLLSLKNSREFFNVQTGLILYQNVIIKSLTAKQDSVTANTLRIIAQCEQVKIANISSTSLPQQSLASGNTADNASSTVQQGNKQSADVTPAQTDTIQTSIIAPLFGG